MAIPESQLKTWSHQGGTSSSSAAYTSIRNALLTSKSPLAGRAVDIFLQGSYANSTNIYGDSDIDVVVYYDQTFYKDMSALTTAQQQLHDQIYPPATYLWQNVRDDVHAALVAYYGSAAVTAGPKSIKVQTGKGGRPSDIVPAVQFRRYATFVDQANLTAHWGIQFLDSSNRPIINYPKYHRERGEEKNQTSRTNGRYKPTIRVFKNFRNYLVERRLLSKGVAPSYFIECALHNAPDSLFLPDLSDSVPSILSYLSTANVSTMLCQNGVTRLMGSEPTQWLATSLTAFLTAAKGAWSNW
ncbi:MAG: nucleotidyltransferase [Candidatus Binataceae bacterium]